MDARARGFDDGLLEEGGVGLPVEDALDGRVAPDHLGVVVAAVVRDDLDGDGVPAGDGRHGRGVDVVVTPLDRRAVGGDIVLGRGGVGGCHRLAGGPSAGHGDLDLEGWLAACDLFLRGGPRRHHRGEEHGERHGGESRRSHGEEGPSGGDEAGGGLVVGDGCLRARGALRG
eukprot:scaffold127274_cov26-Prasinocladus_malaysianus.AAC.1